VNTRGVAFPMDCGHPGGVEGLDVGVVVITACFVTKYWWCF